MHIHEFIFNSFQTRCCVVWDEDRKCAITDPGCQSEPEIRQLTDFIEANGLEPVCIMLTHGHFDHILGVAELAAKYSIPVYMHPEDKFTLENNAYFSRMFGVPMPDAFDTQDIEDGDAVKVGNLSFEVIFTPGHSRGGTCFYERTGKVLICGDTLFAGAIGRTDHPGGDYDILMRSIFEKLLMLDGETRILPGHGPSSDISTERMTNPFLMPFNEPYED
jgi:glyoxylase-like metal-dependent hydrolase (beta-lactamase superfamily II)